MTHDHGDEPFPRHALVDLVSAEEASRNRRQVLQGWAIGLALALLALGLEVANDLAPRVDALCTALGLPTSLAALRSTAEVELAVEAIIAGMAHDKKGRVGTPELVLVLAPGKLELGIAADSALLSKILAT